VLRRLGPTEENAAFFNELHDQLNSAMGLRRRNPERQVHRPPEQVLEEFRRSVAKTLAHGYPDYQGFGDWPVPRAIRHLRPAHMLACPNPPLHSFPHLLPTYLFVPGLSDLLHRAQIRQARAIAAVGARMCATGNPLQVARELLPTRRRRATAQLFLTHLIALEREGRAEEFWRHCAAAAAELLHDDVDYRHREQVCHDEDAYLAATAAEPSAYVRTVRTWLVDQWACTYTSSNVRPSVRDGTIEHFDRDHGPGMRAALGSPFVVGSGVTRLPLALEPLPDESWPSYLTRWAAQHGTTLAGLGSHLGLRDERGRWPGRFGVSLSPGHVERVAPILGLAPHQVENMQLATYDQLAFDMSGLQEARAIAGTRAAVHSSWVWLAGSTFCPSCLTEDDGAWRTSWRIPWITTCLRHEVGLLGHCRECGVVPGLGNRFHGSAPMRVAAAPDGRRCQVPMPDGQSCGADLSRQETYPQRMRRAHNERGESPFWLPVAEAGSQVLTGLRFRRSARGSPRSGSR
jgi:hypothetical protein